MLLKVNKCDKYVAKFEGEVQMNGELGANREPA